MAEVFPPRLGDKNVGWITQRVWIHVELRGPEINPPEGQRVCGISLHLGTQVGLGSKDEGPFHPVPLPFKVCYGFIFDELSRRAAPVAQGLHTGHAESAHHFHIVASVRRIVLKRL